MELTQSGVSFIEQIFDHQPEAAVFARPVWDGDPLINQGQIKDFEFAYCNDAIQYLNGKTKDQLVGKCILRDKLPDPGIHETIFQQCLSVYETGQPMEYTYFSTELEKYVSLQRVKIMDGVLTTARNRTEEYKTQVEKQQQARLLQSLIDNSPYGVSLYESIRNKQGEIVDFKLRLCNQKSADITAFSLKELYANTVRQLMAIREQSAYFDICVQVVESGEPQSLEHYSPVLDQWLCFSIVKFEDGYLLNYIDITKTKKLEEEARHNAHELNAIFDSSLSGVYSAKAVRNEKGKVSDLVFLRANKSFYRIFSITEEQVIGRSLSTISGNDDHSAFLRLADEIMTTGVPAVQILHYKEPERWFEFSMVKLEEDVLSITVNNITAQKLASAEIERQKNLLDTILKQSPNGLSITKAIRDEQGNMIDAIAVLMNDACEKMNGVPNEVLLNNTMGMLDPGILSSPLFRSAKELQTGESFRTEYLLPLSNRWLELAVAKMDNDHFINVFTDITSIKEGQLQLERMIETLRRSNENLEEFTSVASHDLKEPIRKVQFFSDHLKTKLDARLSEEETLLFDKLSNAASRMKLLLDDLLAYSHASLQPAAMEEVDLNAKIKMVLSDLELPIEEKKADIRIGNLPTVKGYRRQIQQVFQNLLSNALKYSKANDGLVIRISAKTIKGAEAGFHLRAEDAGKSFHLIEVSDNGIGFEQQYAEKIFNVFTRLHGNKEYPGTGVGLAIVRKVIENHRGYVWAESKPGEGATFKLLLPGE